IAFDQAGLPIEQHVRSDPSMLRPAEVDHLIGDSTKARDQLGWQPEVNFEQLIRMMVDSDYEMLKHETR
ncbi:MAG TPA: GDP-mannose 4,6-dehydratase, partial [Solirubrobacteraceae bacterium]